MYKVAIVEDDKESVQKLQSFIEQYTKETGEKFSVSVFSDGEDITTDYEPVYDIIFMDVEMPHMDGMTAAERIRQVDPEVVLFFVTNMAQYAIHGYKVEALVFLVKPVTYFVFSQELKKSIERINMRKKNFLLVSTEGGMLRINVSEISYIESIKHNLIIHTKKDSYTINGTMKSMEEKLAEMGFFRCNNGYLVNLDKVEYIKQNIVTVDGTELQISRPKKKAFLETLAKYAGMA